MGWGRRLRWSRWVSEPSGRQTQTWSLIGASHGVTGVVTGEVSADGASVRGAGIGGEAFFWYSPHRLLGLLSNRVTLFVVYFPLWKELTQIFSSSSDQIHSNPCKWFKIIWVFFSILWFFDSCEIRRNDEIIWHVVFWCCWYENHNQNITSRLKNIIFRSSQIVLFQKKWKSCWRL